MRFIPTYVGHTAALTEYLRGLAGSSPHTWGIQRPLPGSPKRCRFIPKYVGHTATKGLLVCATTVHPHIRGAYGRLAQAERRDCGSSPHTWGIHSGFGQAGQGGRFIPTYVGHTALAMDVRKGKTVHPHIRGAYEGRATEVELECGSSPHTWGIRQGHRTE